MIRIWPTSFVLRAPKDEPCRHPQHNPPIHLMGASGVYEHVCPGCGELQRFRVDAVADYRGFVLAVRRRLEEAECELQGGGVMPHKLDTSQISLTTVQGYLSAGAVFALSLVPIFPGHAAWFAAAASVMGGLKAAVGTLQQDATKPTDSEGKPVASSEVPVKGA